MQSKRNIITILLLLLLSSNYCYAQGEDNIWCFGHGTGFDFSTGAAVVYPSSITAGEGCATVCDAAGQLVFYASPTKVWNKNHALMPNGTGLIGDNSTTHGTSIIQSYGNPNQYFVFTMESLASGVPKLYYSVVDMSLAGGLGDVVTAQKNILLDSDVTEKMIPAMGNGCYSWLIVHHRDNPVFHAFKVDASGVNMTPVISNTGIFAASRIYGQGEMKISPNDSNIVITCHRNDDYQLTARLEMYSFNNSTGVVSNPLVIDSTNTSLTHPALYGTSFSPDGTKLYGAGEQLYQYDITLLPNVAAVLNSRVAISPLFDLTGMRIGPDNRIYVMQNGFGAIINNPNASGLACNFVTNVFTFSGVPISYGNKFLPNPPGSSYVTHDTTLCMINPLTLSAPGGYTSYQWSDGKTTQTDTISGTGIKWVISSKHCIIRIDTFHVTATPLITTKKVTDTAICFVNNIPVLSGAAGYTTYAWSDGKTTQTDTMGAPGTKWVKAQTGCTVVIDTFHVRAKMDTTRSSRDTTHCVAHSPISIAAAGGYTSYVWSDGKTTQSDTFFSTTTKWVRAVSGCNMLIDTIHFTANTIPNDSLTAKGTDTTLCFEATGPVNMDGPPGYTYYLWSDGTNTQTVAFSAPGTKWVYAQQGCKLLIDTFSVSARGTDTMLRRRDTTACFTQSIIVSAANGYDTYAWSDGSTGQTNTFSTEGIKIAYAHKPCMELVDTFHVQFVNNLSVNLGKDTFLCKGQAIRLDAATNTMHANVRYLWQDGRTDAIYNATDGGLYIVRVSVGPCSVSDTIKVQLKQINADLGDGKAPCGQDILILDCKVDNASYLWQDGSTRKTFAATAPGAYSVKVTQGDCNTTAKVDVIFEPCECLASIPNIFSPNGDGKNDEFGPSFNCNDISDYQFIIYNRWGNEVFHANDVSDKWDGKYKGQPADGNVFFYYLQFKDGLKKVNRYKGDVTVLK